MNKAMFWERVAGFMGFENVTVTGLFGPIPVPAFGGMIDTTVGGTLSVVAAVVKQGFVAGAMNGFPERSTIDELYET
jgi:hypothetical protein